MSSNFHHTPAFSNQKDTRSFPNSSQRTSGYSRDIEFVKGKGRPLPCKLPLAPPIFKNP